MTTRNFEIDLLAASRGYDRQTCWTQARAGVLPASHPDAEPTIVLTMQKLRLIGSDDYEAIHSQYSNDRGKTWSSPVLQPGFARESLDANALGSSTPVERVVCDFWPKWHAASGKLLGTGHTAYYSADRLMANRPRETPYSIYDPVTRQWQPWRILEMPDKEKFRHAGAGCTQRVDLPSGEILLPIYFKTGEPFRASATVVRCSFDGETLEYLEHGDELTVPVARGFVEPSLAYYQDRFFLSLRNDVHNQVAVGHDGLHFGEPQPWRFDDGEEIGSYNTQTHWVTQPDALFLVYTRRGLNNDHVFRHRAPLMMAQVDPEKLCLVRDSERVIIPERGARLGNFGITEVDESETWVVEAEWMQNSGEWGELMQEKIAAAGHEITGPSPHLCRECEYFGSDNTVWTARLLWEDS